MTDIEALIARLEAATEGSAELDRAIHLVIFADFIRERGMVEDGDGWRDPQYGGVAPPQFYTTSVDAALTLVPQGVTWAVNTGYPPRQYRAEVDYMAAVWAKTAALALCIAALKARSEIPRGTGDGE